MECATASNPWIESWRDCSLLTFVPYLILFVLLNEIGRWIGRRCRDKNPLSVRPTVLAGCVHAAICSGLSFYVLLVGGDENHDRWYLWQTVALPLSISYFLVDTVYYCYPRSDGLISVHHIVISFCHFPALTISGATLASACYDPEWSMWISAMGYTAEISTVLMNYRWYLLQTLEQDWWGFALTNICVLLTWAGRVILYPYLLLIEIVPKIFLYVEKKQILFFIIMVLGHCIIGFLSLYWLVIMMRGGIKSLFTFKKKNEKRSGSEDRKEFSFGNDIGRGRSVHSRGNESTKIQSQQVGPWISFMQRARDWATESTPIDSHTSTTKRKTN